MTVEQLLFLSLGWSIGFQLASPTCFGNGNFWKQEERHIQPFPYDLTFTVELCTHKTCSIFVFSSYNIWACSLSWLFTFAYIMYMRNAVLLYELTLVYKLCVWWSAHKGRHFTTVFTLISVTRPVSLAFVGSLHLRLMNS